MRNLNRLETLPRIIQGIQNVSGPQWLIDLLVQVQSLKPEAPYKVFFSDLKLNRSRSQNRYLWGVVYKVISDSTGYEPEELHELFKIKFGLRTVFNFGGDVVEAPRSTANMNTKEMTDYIEAVRRWAAEREIYVPNPNEIPDEVYIDYIER